MKQILPSLVFISGKTPSEDYTSELLKDLKHESYGVAHGCYKGEVELSFFVVVNDDQHLKSLISLASHYKQECIMFADDKRNCSFIYPNGKVQVVGKLRNISKTQAESQDFYTYVPALDQYFLAS